MCVSPNTFSGSTSPTYCTSQSLSGLGGGLFGDLEFVRANSTLTGQPHIILKYKIHKYSQTNQ